MKSIKSQQKVSTPTSVQPQPSGVKSGDTQSNEPTDAASIQWLPGFDPAPADSDEPGEESPAPSNLASDSDPIAASAIPLTSKVRVPRVSVITNKRQRISGIQPITTATDTLCEASQAILKVLNEHAYQHIETSTEGVQVEYRLSSVGRSKLTRLTGLNRTTVRLAIKRLEKRHLVELHVPADPYLSKPAIYRLYDPFVAAERMRGEDGIAIWRQRGRGRVVCPSLYKLLNRE